MPMREIAEKNQAAIDYLVAIMPAMRQRMTEVVDAFFEERKALEEKKAKRYRLQPTLRVSPSGTPTVAWAVYRPNPSGKLVTEYIRKGAGNAYRLPDLKKACSDEHEYALVKKYELRFVEMREYIELIVKAKRQLNAALNRINKDGDMREAV